ncbi:MAG: C-GCAxxG-C-C family protein [Candidatus Gastranaerophilales bacterium]|nr:C-GCAxxG-C-C family protein [Candidatus Gastranaerophilales bacterium]
MKAVEHFMQGCSCSESIVREAIDLGICDESAFPIATAFSGGMGSGCLCGAISGAQIVIGHLFGKNNKHNNDILARNLAKEFMDKFKEAHKVTCCRVLSKDFEFHSPERKKHCCNFVEFCSKTLQEIIDTKVKNG